MSKKSNNGDPFKELFSLFEGIYSIFIGIGVIIKWIIDSITFVLLQILRFINWTEQKDNKKEIEKNILKEPFKNTNTEYKQKEVINRESILTKLNLFNIDIYNDIFPTQIKNRGEEYYEQGKIKYYKQNNNKYTCRIQGTKLYDVSITFDKNNDTIIESASCTCPYHQEDSKKCKHIYALLYKIKCEHNKEILRQEIEKVASAIGKMIDKTTKLLRANLNNYPSNITSNYKNIILPYLDTIVNILKLSVNCQKEETLIKYMQTLLTIKEDVQIYVKEILNSETGTLRNNYTPDSYEDMNSILSSFNQNQNEEDIYENDYGYTKEQLEHLEPWQLELVKKGEYDPSGFEEEEPEDDDWHSDDEKEINK